MFSFLRRASFKSRNIALVLTREGLYDAEAGVVDGFIFDIYPSGQRRRSAGYVSLRQGESAGLYYLGHIGYRVEPPFRGHGYAAEAVQLLLPLMRECGLQSVVITTDEDNIPSRRTCEKLGCVLESVVPVPERYRELCMGARSKCRYILETAERNNDAD